MLHLSMRLDLDRVRRCYLKISLEHSKIISNLEMNSSSPMNMKVPAIVFLFFCLKGNSLLILANNGPWKRLAARRNAVVKYWHPIPVSAENPYSVTYRIDELLPLVSSRTRLAAITACSNILGSVLPVEEIVKSLRQRAKEQGAIKMEVALDCVAYASHRRIDVKKWDVDYCVFSVYKVSISATLV